MVQSGSFEAEFIYQQQQDLHSDHCFPLQGTDHNSTQTTEKICDICGSGHVLLSYVYIKILLFSIFHPGCMVLVIL
jgi:hypothetical protein